jgi:uncharacterized phage-associated protein
LPLISESFEAWDYGPVVPDLYRRAKGFGKGPVRNVFHWIPKVPQDSPDYAVLREVEEATRGISPGRLVSITHWEDGAWARYYIAGSRGIRIPNSAILDEYRERIRDTPAAA